MSELGPETQIQLTLSDEHELLWPTEKEVKNQQIQQLIIGDNI